MAAEIPGSQMVRPADFKPNPRLAKQLDAGCPFPLRVAVGKQLSDVSRCRRSQDGVGERVQAAIGRQRRLYASLLQH